MFNVRPELGMAKNHIDETEVNDWVNAETLFCLDTCLCLFIYLSNTLQKKGVNGSFINWVLLLVYLWTEKASSNVRLQDRSYFQL